MEVHEEQYPKECMTSVNGIYFWVTTTGKFLLSLSLFVGIMFACHVFTDHSPYDMICSWFWECRFPLTR